METWTRFQSSRLSNRATWRARITLSRSSLRSKMKAMLRATLIALALTAPAQAAGEPDAITRQIGLDMLRQRMLERIHIDHQAPGYWGVGYDVRIG